MNDASPCLARSATLRATPRSDQLATTPLATRQAGPARSLMGRAARCRRFILQLLLGLLGTGAGAVQAAPVPGALAAAAPAGVAADSRAAPVRYRIINLAPGALSATPAINASGQVAFSVSEGDRDRAGFFDGQRVLAVGRPEWPINYATAVNATGQVAGFGGIDFYVTRAFRWSVGTGLQELDSAGMAANAVAINAPGEIAGAAAFALSPPHAYRWTAAGLREDLGTLNNGTTAAVAINDAGLIAGASDVADGGVHAFAWTRANGIRDLGTLGGSYSYATAVDAAGDVAGYSALAGTAGNVHAFLWSAQRGMRDLGTAGAIDSFPLAMNAGGQIAGVINLSNGYQHGISWTAASGMVDIGTLGGASSRALAINGAGVIAGIATDKQETARAVLWRPGFGLTDLNSQVVNAPAGLLLDAAAAVSDNGAIVATSNAGLVLLRPLGQPVSKAPVAGPVMAADTVRPGTPLAVSVAFNDSEAGDLHHASWQWGDQTMETALVDEKNGSGSVSGRHVYASAGIYTIVAQVTDRSGNSVTVRKEVVVAEPDQGANLRLLSPAGSLNRDPSHGGTARLRFIVPAITGGGAGPGLPSDAASGTGAKVAALQASRAAEGSGAAGAGGMLRFTSAGMRFVSDNMRAQATGTAGPSRTFEGRGSLNGRAGYYYRLSTAAMTRGTSGTAAVDGQAGAGSASSAPAGTAAPSARLRIWHLDPVSGAERVDYDNNAGSGGTAAGASTQAIESVTMAVAAGSPAPPAPPAS